MGCSSDDYILPCTHVLLLIVLNRFKGGKNPTTLLSATVSNVGVVLAQEEWAQFWFLKERSTMIGLLSFLFCVFLGTLVVSSLVALPSWV